MIVSRSPFFVEARVHLLSVEYNNIARRRKRLLLTFAVLGSLSSLFFLILPSTSVLWPASAFLAIVANVSFGTSIVSHNSYLPQLARGEEDVRGALTKISMSRGSPSSDILLAEDERREDDEHEDDEHAPLTTGDAEASAADGYIHPDSVGLTTYNELLSRATSRISSRGIAIGYTAGIILLLLILIPVTLLKGSTFSMRLSIGMTGLWWAAFTVPAALWLPSDAGSPVPGVAQEHVSSGSEDSAETNKRSDIWEEILAAWRRLGYMLHPKEISKLRNTFWFLLAWFFLSDGKFSLIPTTSNIPLCALLPP
jgi:MFS transporter, UMF1 family